MLIPFDQLFARYKIQAPGVLHLGANTGQEAEAYQKHGVKRVVWVEALPSLIPLLAAHVTRFPGQLVLCACLSDTNGQKVTFNVASNQAQSSSFLEFGTHATEHPTVRYVDSVELETVRADTLLERLEVDIGENWFLNVDLQGAELLALRGMGTLLTRFRYVYIEVNERELYKGCPLVGEIDVYLASFGFVAKEVKMTGNGWGDKFYMKG